jgi:hypothetical protein
MKGIPAAPKCGFSNMVVKILEMEGAGQSRKSSRSLARCSPGAAAPLQSPRSGSLLTAGVEDYAAYDILADEELRQGKLHHRSPRPRLLACLLVCLALRQLTLRTRNRRI